MLTVYRRHSAAKCGQESRTYRRCSCPIWVDGTLGGKRYHKSLKTKNWERANKDVQAMEASGKSPDKRASVTEATDSFIRDAEARGLRESSLYKYRLLFKQLKSFAEEKGLRFLAEFDVDTLRKFRESWTNKNFSARKKLEAMRTFFKFAHASGWIGSNPALQIQPPETDDVPTLPFTRDEFARVLAACNKYPNKKNAARLYALVLLLRYSGLRITDAVTLQRHQIEDDILTLRTAKTRTDVRLPLHPDVVKALEALPEENAYYFWSGQGTKKSVVGDYQRAFKKLYKLAGVNNGHAHRWRDTFAVELLLAGKPIEQVSVLLGHQSIKVTEKYYNPWVKARQEQAEKTVRDSWANQPKNPEFEPHKSATTQNRASNSQ
jgi:integrase/recombinase XerD